jgi:O-antigen/teichoic acid export membrane protein
LVEIRRIYRRGLIANIAVAHAAATILMLGAGVIATLVLPSRAETGAQLLRILALAYGLYAANAVGFFTAQGLGVPALNARWVLISGVIFIVALTVAVDTGSILAAAWANAAYAVTLALNFAVGHRIQVGVRQQLAIHMAYAASLGVTFLLSTYVAGAEQSLAVRLAVAAVVALLPAPWVIRSVGNWRWSGGT